MYLNCHATQLTQNTKLTKCNQKLLNISGHHASKVVSTKCNCISTSISFQKYMDITIILRVDLYRTYIAYINAC